MSDNLYEAYVANPYDGLIVSSSPPTDVFRITIRKLGQEASYKRGTLLALSTGSTGDNKMVIHGTTPETGETLTANCILDNDYVIGTVADVTAVAYRTGHFAENKLTVKDGASISAVDKEALRDVGILLSNAFPVT